MRILILANGIVGLEIVSFLRELNEDIIGIGLHEKSIRRLGDQIIKKSGVSENNIIFGNVINSKKSIITINKLKPDIIISAFWAYILKKDLINIPKYGCINLHPGFLPSNRGKNPNVWPIVDGSPGGICIHYVDEGIDTGDIIVRKTIKVEETDTGGSFYNKTLKEIVTLFKQNWGNIKMNKHKSLKQCELKDNSSFHYGKDVDELDKIYLDRTYTGREIINILRARTYDNKSFAYYLDSKKNKIHIGVFFNN